MNNNFITSRITALVLPVLVAATPVLAADYDLEAIHRDVERYFEAVLGIRSLKDHYYFNGEGGESELVFELNVCGELGIDEMSEQCRSYHRCRYENMTDRVSYMLTLESSYIPRDTIHKEKKINVEWLGKGMIPNLLVHVELEGSVYTFSRVVDKEEAVQFGRLSLMWIDGKPLEIPVYGEPFEMSFPSIDLMEVFNNDPCRHILLDKQ